MRPFLTRYTSQLPGLPASKYGRRTSLTDAPVEGLSTSDATESKAPQKISAPRAGYKETLYCRLRGQHRAVIYLLPPGQLHSFLRTVSCADASRILRRRPDNLPATCLADVTCSPAGTLRLSSANDVLTGLNLTNLHSLQAADINLLHGGNAVDIKQFVDPVSGKNAGHA